MSSGNHQALAKRPSALLLDFGGVLVDTPQRSPNPPAGLIDHLSRLSDGMVPASRIDRNLVDGARAYARWRDEVSALGHPVELGHAEVWDRFVTADWPAKARGAVRRNAFALSYAWSRDPGWAVRPGIRELLDRAVTTGLPVAIVSNTLCGAAHRDFLHEVHLADRFAAQFYSDEIGARKPNPDMAWQAAQAVGTDIGDCWFVGDSRIRDIACARRAGVGAAILMRSTRTAREPDSPDLEPDATVGDGYGVLALLNDGNGPGEGL